jgi:DNA-binding protein H-NS
MPSLQDLLAQKEALDRRIIEVQREERNAAIAKVKSLMAEYGLTAADLASRPAGAARGGRKSGAGHKVAPKYRNAETGETWSGRGLQPNWLKAALASGRKISDFKL